MPYSLAEVLSHAIFGKAGPSLIIIIIIMKVKLYL
jgi:hypothetical protein